MEYETYEITDPCLLDYVAELRGKIEAVCDRAYLEAQQRFVESDGVILNAISQAYASTVVISRTPKEVAIKLVKIHIKNMKEERVLEVVRGANVLPFAKKKKG